MKIEIPAPTDLSVSAKRIEPRAKILFKKWRKQAPKNLDDIVHTLHNQYFEQFDCLTCANCCRGLGPRITDKDLERMSKYLKLKPQELIEKYLRIDEDNDFVFKTMPCPFLLPDNYCSIYTERPKACREYPHTDRRRFEQILNITQKNIAVCPVVCAIVETLLEN